MKINLEGYRFGLTLFVNHARDLYTSHRIKGEEIPLDVRLGREISRLIELSDFGRKRAEIGVPLPREKIFECYLKN